MRLALCLVLCCVAASARGQEQERKLVYRLLEPNMKLANPEQNRQFNGASNVTTASASTRSFYVPEKKLSQNFAGTREMTTTAFQSRSFTTRDANLPAAAHTSTYETKNARGVAPAREAPAKYQTRSFAGNRPFTEEGKSQKSLHAQDHPLSIDDVRELLNKNK
jgi:hypothetical protein